MRALSFIFLTLAIWLGGSGNAGAQSAPPIADSPIADPYARGPHLQISLIAETTTPAAGRDVTLAYDVQPQPGWHGYWQNPGDAGFPAKFQWSLPTGVTADAPRYPVPTTLLISGLMNYVFEQHYTPLITLHLAKDLAAGTKIPVRLKSSYLVCTQELCVPESAELLVELIVGNGAISPASQSQFDIWRRLLPRPIGIGAHYQADGKHIRIGIPYPASAPADNAYFFPLTTGAVDYAAPQKVTRDGDRLVIDTGISKATSGAIDGVLRIDGAQGLSVTATPGAVPPAQGAAAAGSPSAVLGATLIALGGAILGGLILNIMPCVFPILSLKALALAKGSVDAAEARREALAYTAGVMVVIVGLGAAILGLRAGGAAIGWAFQLQDPRTIAVLLLLVVALTLNLAGLFEIPTPRFVDRASGANGAFATGALAAIIATPCTGPFMAAALGTALVLPWMAGLAVFAGLGLGLALPFLAIGFVPALRRRLPKPGAWMEVFRQILALPMGLTAVWLASVLSAEAGTSGITIGLLGVFCIAVVLFIVGKRQRLGLSAHWLSGLALIAVTAGAMATVHSQPRQTAAASTSQSDGDAMPFSEEKLAGLRARGRPIFAYFTADWCLTCKINERVAIETDQVRQAFARHHVAVLVGDWTDGDPALGRFIQAHNRAGVPLYLYYPAGGGEPQVLPQVLTPGSLAALAR